MSNYKQILKWIHAFINFKEFSSNLQQKQQAYKELSKSIHRSRMEKNSSKSKTEEENQREIEKDIKNSSEKFFQDSVTELDSLFKTCLDSFFVIAFFAESKIGQMIFETLNSRGKPLEVQDLLKNYIIRKTDDRDLDDIIKSWDDIINNVGENHIAKFLLAFYQANKRKSSNADLFHNYRNFATNPPEILKLLEDLRKASIHFKKIICPESRNQRISKELTAALSDLNTIDSTSFHPLLLLLFMNESKPAHIEKVAKNCLVILLRNKTIMGDKADDLMNMSLDLCTKVRDKNPTESYSEIKNKFETMFAKHSDNSFISKLIEKQFKGKDATARILLTKIYLNLGQLPPPEYQLEHIIPQAVAKRLTERSPKGVTEWIEYLNSYKLDKDNMIYRIGNFTLLDRDAQLDAGTKFIDEKIKVFKKSPLKQIDEITENDFTEQGFEDRCERLSKHVAKALVVKF